jgi:uncharacterized membrane protein YedE/YeeE
MNIDWIHFTPLKSLEGGILIGLASTLLILWVGRIAGISGIIGGLIEEPTQPQSRWRFFFILGLLLSPWLYQTFSSLPVPSVTNHPLILVLAGLLVGIGTRYGAGCTSGHGVCGLSRLSPRSLVATVVFMLAGFMTVFIVKHLI